MSRKRLQILECDAQAFESSEQKNKWIAQSVQEYVGFVNNEVTNAEEVQSVFDENEFLYDYDVVLFGKGSAEGECDFVTVLSCLQMEIFGFCFRKELLRETGSFNTKLIAGTNYEFLCRLAETKTIFCVPCDAPDCQAAVRTEAWADTCAYMLRRYWAKLTKLSLQNEMLQFYGKVMVQQESFPVFKDRLQTYFQEEDRYREIAGLTAPFLILYPDNTCYGVLADFAEQLETELLASGQAVTVERNIHVPTVQQTVWKGIIGFQAPVLESDWMQNIKGRKIQFWFDNPAFFNTLFRQNSEVMYLCQDAFYAEHLKRFYKIKHAYQLSPGGTDCGLAHNEQRDRDVVFIGTYEAPRMDDNWNETEKSFYEYMLQHRHLTFEEGLAKFIQWDEKEAGSAEFLRILWQMAPVCRTVVRKNRENIIGTILEAGIAVDVYGESWKEFPSAYKSNLRIHREVTPKEALQILGHAKIGLNIMTWHKAGMTERVANILLSGAVCLSDETVYLREHFENGKELLLYSLAEMQQLPNTIKWLLEHEELRRQIAAAGYRKAMQEHTWHTRTEQMLELLEAVEAEETC